jgi:hypothetical protein
LPCPLGHSASILAIDLVASYDKQLRGTVVLFQPGSPRHCPTVSKLREVQRERLRVHIQIVFISMTEKENVTLTLSGMEKNVWIQIFHPHQWWRIQEFQEVGGRGEITKPYVAISRAKPVLTKFKGASVAERHRSHTTRPLTSSPRRFEPCSYSEVTVRKFVRLLAEGSWPLGSLFY